MPFGNWLKREIENRLQTQREFADAAGLPLGTLQAWLYTDQTPNGRNIVRLAITLGVSRQVIEDAMKHATAA